MLTEAREVPKSLWPKLCLALFMLSAVMAGSAQTTRYSLNFTLSKKNFADTIQIDYVQGQVIVPVEAGGRQLRFLLDTGSGQAVVFPDTPLADSPSAGTIRSHDATGHVRKVRVVALPPLTIGSLTLTGCRATLQQRVVRGSRIDGILGFDLVNKGLCMKIDTRHKRLILTDRKGFFDREQGVDSRYRLDYHVPYIELSPFGKYREYALFDTGSRKLYVMNRQSFERGWKKWRTEAEAQVEGRSVGRHALGHQGTERKGEVVFLCLQRLLMGDFTFSQVHTLTTQGGSHLGAMVLDYGAIVFNPHRHRMRFQPYGNRLKATVDNCQTDIAFVPEDGRPVVGLVWERGEPFRLGFREGDVIEAIDGREVPGMAVFARWGFEKGRAYTFTVRDKQGRTKNIPWVRLK